MTRLLLAGGGHAHVEVLRRFAYPPNDGAEVVVVAPAPGLLYSGMVPGAIAGAYEIGDATIDLVALAGAAGARLIQGTIVALDANGRRVTLSDGTTIGFDLASLDVGATTAMPAIRPGAHAIPVRPLAGLVEAWARMRNDAARGAIRAIAIVGGGAAGVELAFAIAHRLGADAGARAPEVAIVTDQPEIAAQHPPNVRRRLARLLASRGIAVVAGSAAQAIDDAGIALADGRRVGADFTVVATAAAAHSWLRVACLACDDAGFVKVDAHLRSTSHSAVFAAGDCATVDGAPHARSGVYAVRAGPPLAENLRRALRGAPLLSYRPQRHALALISVGPGYAVASRPPLAAEGAWVWRWKDRIDRAFVARYREIG